jgi:phosphatidylinositol alpha-mannosyltransferase
MAHDALGGDYTLLFNGIEVDRYVKAPPWPTEGPTIFFIGRHEPRKGLAILLEAMRSLPADTRLWVASDGPETAALQARHGNDSRIEWLGRIDEDEKASRMRGADVFCAPSLRGESFGVVLLEGMAAQTPVVASDLPGYHNVARSGADAVLVPPGDAGALSLALANVLENPTCAERLVASGQQRAEEFSMDNLAARYGELYERIA